MTNSKYDLAIIGGGPAGVTAGIYAARKRLRTILITYEFGGQSNVSADIQNWIGTPHISGKELAENLEAHLREYEDGEILTIDQPTLVENIEKTDLGFKIVTNKDASYESSALLYAAGSSRRKLPAKNADKFEHKGLTYCATCDGPLFSGRDVVVIGGGNSAFETAAQLSAYTKSVTLIDRSERFVADAITVSKVKKISNVKTISDAEIVEILGDVMVTGVKYRCRSTGEEKIVETQGVFVEIGMIPNTKALLKMNEDTEILTDYNTVAVDPWTQQTKIKNMWAAGDCTNVLYHQNSIAMGDATKAVEDIYANLKAR